MSAADGKGDAALGPVIIGTGKGEGRPGGGGPPGCGGPPGGGGSPILGGPPGGGGPDCIKQKPTVL
jgi:hypothetical protein